MKPAQCWLVLSEALPSKGDLVMWHASTMSRIHHGVRYAHRQPLRSCPSAIEIHTRSTKLNAGYGLISFYPDRKI